MADDTVAPLRLERRFAAPPDAVFDAWTSPGCDVDLRVGGEYRLRMRTDDGTIHAVAGEFERRVRRRLLTSEEAKTTMANFLLAYRGGGMAATDQEREAAMAEWGRWFGSLGQAVVDGGAPFATSRSVTALAKGCPILASGGSVDIYESLPM
jgi:Activator of Hsp90 ATPase homolog 1-like protein